jgi:MoaA/NifB/PqqE/SkfB family radical SAM enzyme
MVRLGLWRFLYAPFHVQLVVTRRCNLSCGYCNEFDDHSPPVPFEELCRRIDKIYELGAWAVEFTGGEPMEHPQLVDLVRYAKQKGFYKVQLISNAYLWNEDTVHALNAAGLDDLQVSVDGVNTNDITIKVLRPLRKKLEVIAKHAKFRVTLNGVIGSAPPGECAQIVEFAKEHGFKPRVSLVHDGDGQFNLTPDQVAEYDHLKHASGGGRMEAAGDYRGRLMATGKAPFKCRSGSRYLYVDEFGVVRWCSQTRDRWGVPLADYSRAELKKQFATRKDCNVGCTIGCVRKASGPDAWRGQRLPDPGPDAPGARATVAPPLVQIGVKPRDERHAQP